MKRCSFDFAQGYQGWQPGFADYLSDNVDSYRFSAELRSLPAALGTGQALFISGMNRSDDLFMFHRRKIAGLAPSKTYDVSFSIELASKYVSAMGIGGDPGRSVHLKGCAATHEPVPTADKGFVRLNIDIGHQANSGANSVVLGDIAKKDDGTNNYAMIKRASTVSLKSVADSNGEMWVLFGTDSGYEGETALFYSKFEVTFA